MFKGINKMQVVYNVDYKKLWTYLYNPKDLADLAPLKFCCDHDSEGVIRVCKKKTDTLINTYTNDYKVKNILTAKQGTLEHTLAEGDYLFDLNTGEAIFDFYTMKPLGKTWSIFPPVNVKHLTLFCVDKNGDLHKMYVGNGLATLAFCIYWANLKLLVPKEITNYGVKATFILLETLYSLPHYDIKDFEEVKKALHPTKADPSVPYTSKIYNHLKLNPEITIPLTLPKEVISGKNITVTKEDKVLLSQIIASGIVPFSEELLFVEMDKNIQHVINISIERGELCIYVDKEIYADQVLLDLGLEDRDDVITIAKDAQLM